MGRLFLVRHAQASFLSQNYDQLSALGETQARLLGEYWARRKMTFDRVCVGPAIRHRQTAQIANSQGVGHPLQQGTTTFKPWARYTRSSCQSASVAFFGPSHPRSSPSRGKAHSRWSSSRVPTREGGSVKRRFLDHQRTDFLRSTPPNASEPGDP